MQREEPRREVGPVDFAQYGMWPTGGAWLSVMLWDRYRFTGDRHALRADYPVMLARFVTETDIDCVLLAGRYSLLDRSGADLLSLCATRGVGVVAGGVFNSGVLAPGADDAPCDAAAQL